MNGAKQAGWGIARGGEEINAIMEESSEAGRER